MFMNRYSVAMSLLLAVGTGGCGAAGDISSGSVADKPASTDTSVDPVATGFVGSGNDPATDAIDERPFTDPETGTTYLMNSNRRVLTGGRGETASSVSSGPGAESVRKVAQALNASGTDTDWSGKVNIQIVECVSPPSTGSISLGCSVSSEYVLIGGGAQDVYTGWGAMLWESRPQDINDSGTGTTWMASSKDHVNASSHTLTTWAVGLKVKKTNGAWMSHAALKAFVHYTFRSSSQSSRPSKTCIVPDGSLVIGGGARSNYTGWGQLLTDSYPQNQTTWYAAAKDHVKPDSATLNVYCIGITPTIAGVGTLVVGPPLSSSDFTNSGVGTAANNITGSPNKSVVGCYGGRASYNGWGRMLFRMAPGDGDIRSFTVASKDHINADSGWTEAWATELRMQ